MYAAGLSISALFMMGFLDTNEIIGIKKYEDTLAVA